jgi:hypothetical protein
MTSCFGVNVDFEKFCCGIDKFGSDEKLYRSNFAVEGRKWVLFLIKFYLNELPEEIVSAGCGIFHLTI